MQGNTQNDNSRRGIFRKAIAVSVLLTAVMAICGSVANMVRPLSWLSYVSRAIGFPPSLIIRHLVKTNSSSMAALVTLELEGVALTLIFYALLAGAVFWFLSRKADRTKK